MTWLYAPTASTSFFRCLHPAQLWPTSALERRAFGRDYIGTMAVIADDRQWPTADTGTRRISHKSFVCNCLRTNQSPICVRDRSCHARHMAMSWHIAFMTGNAESLLQIEGLTLDFDVGKPTEHRALEGVSLSIGKGEVVGLVGESGSGKTVLAHSILGLLPANGRITSGCIAWCGCELRGLPENKLRRIRGKEIAMIFQDPQASLNPVYTAGKLRVQRDGAGWHHLSHLHPAEPDCGDHLLLPGKIKGKQPDDAESRLLVRGWSCVACAVRLHRLC
jgi:hypothetical protein